MRRGTATVFAGLGALMLAAAAPVAAPAAAHPGGHAAAGTNLAHMGDADDAGAAGKGTRPWSGGRGMMGPGTAGRGMTGPGMMGGGMMGSMTGPGMMSSGGAQGCPGAARAWAPGAQGSGMMDFAHRVTPTRDVTVEDVRHFLEHRLAWHGNKRLKVGEVKVADDDTIVADIVTVDGSLVRRLKVDRHSGAVRPAQTE